MIRLTAIFKVRALRYALFALSLAPRPASAVSGSPGDLLSLARLGDIAPLERHLPEISDPAVQALARLEIDAAHRRTADVDAAMARYLEMADVSVDRTARAWSLVAGVDFSDGRYRAAADAATHWSALLGRGDPYHDATGAEQTRSIAALLASAPAMSVSKGAGHRISTMHDKAGLLRARMKLNGVAQSAVLDTGANVSVISASAAQKLHLHIIDGAGAVASSSRQTVPVKLGIADRLGIAGITFRNVPFLILDDRQLQMPVPGGYAIDAIIGFPIFRAIGAVTFGRGYFEPARPVSSEGAAELTAQGSDLFVRLSVAGYGTALHIDTGATASELSAAFTYEHPGILNNLKRSQIRIGSAGGAASHQIAHYPHAAFVVAADHFELPDLAIATAASPEMADTTFGTLGQDILNRFSSYTLDLDTMRLGVAAKLADRTLPHRRLTDGKR